MGPMDVATLLLAATLSLSASGRALVQDASTATESIAPKRQFTERQLAQQQRMKDCVSEAKANTLRGDARKAFMKTCLSGGMVTVEAGGESASALSQKRAAQWASMKSCSAKPTSEGPEKSQDKNTVSSCLTDE